MQLYSIHASVQVLARALAITILVQLSACGTFAFKRGSGADAFAAAEHSCRAADPAPGAVRHCLAKNGWHVADLEPDEPPPPPAVAPEPAPPPPATAAASGPFLSKAPANAAVPPREALAPQPAYAPTDRISVGAWFKYGGGSADLHEAAEACIASLGPAHSATSGYHSVTRALYACLKRHGWRGLGHAAL